MAAALGKLVMGCCGVVPKLSKKLPEFDEDGFWGVAVLVDPNPLYLLVDGMCALTSRCNAANPSGSLEVTAVATLPAVDLREFQKLPPTDIPVLARLPP